MLKLIKYEFIHSIRTYAIAFAVFLVGCFAMPIIGNFDAFGNTYNVIFIILSMGMWFLVIGILIALMVSIFKNFSTSMFKKPGYLTLTLPVTSTQLIIAKTIAAILWLCIGGIVLLLGLFLLVFSIQMTYEGFDAGLLFRGVWELTKDFFNMIGAYPKETFITILSLFGQALLTVSTIFLTMTLIHTRRFLKHKVLFGTTWFVVLNLSTGWIIGKIMNLFSNPNYNNFGMSEMYMDTNIFLSTNMSLFPYALMTILFGCLFTLATIYLVDHHIELE